MKKEEVATLKYETTPTKVQAFRLVAVEGPAKGQVFEIPMSDSRILLGTSPACSLHLGDPHVSRRHVALGLAADRLELQDLGSSNGTWVNGVSVVECALHGGESVRIGSTVLRVEALGELTYQDDYLPETFERAIGPSRVMRRIFAACARLAHVTVPLLIEGETGTGKELLAECIHNHGSRKGAPFLVFDPSLVPEHLMIGVLFGAEAGALPGPMGDVARAGLFEQAHGGTLLLDGPVDLPLDVQRKLVRVVERGEVQRAGSAQALKVDVRVITLSSQDLDRAVDEGRLREDLFYRLAGARLELPPLRKRREDIHALFAHFWAELGGATQPLPNALVARYENHAFPGNVRELQNAVAAHLATGELTGDGPESEASVGFKDLLELDLPFPQARQQALATFEAAYVTRLLEKHGGNVSRAAAASGVAHRYFQLLKARHRR